MSKTIDMFRGTRDIDHGARLPTGFLIDGRYVVDEYLAAGGFATVYRAHHAQIERNVAIKVLEPSSRKSDEEFAERFLQEARVAARISHPSVVDVFDFGMLDDGRAYIAMELLEGHDLEYELERYGPVRASRIVPLVADCLAALEEGHQKGIVHKDLKPSNLFLVKPRTDQERLVILDFGIARVFADPGAHITREGGFSGTPAYLAPEYIRYQKVTPAIDIYQIGLILVEALTGEPAVRADSSLGYLLAHCTQPILLPKVLHDSNLGGVCARALAKEPETRWPSAAEFREALLRIDPKDLRDTEPFESVPPREGNGAVVFESSPTAPLTDAKTLQFIDVTQPEFEAALAQSEFSDAEASLEDSAPAPTADRGSQGVSAVASVSSSASPSASQEDQEQGNDRLLVLVAAGLVGAVLIAGSVLATGSGMFQERRPPGSASEKTVEARPEAPPSVRAVGGEDEGSDIVPTAGTDAPDQRPQPAAYPTDAGSADAGSERDSSQSNTATRALPGRKKRVRRKQAPAPANVENTAGKGATLPSKSLEKSEESSSPLLLSP